MKNASRLYDALLSFVGQSGWSDLRHASVLVWMVIGVIHEGSVNLTDWLSHVETPARQAQSTQRRNSCGGYTIPGFIRHICIVR